MRGTSRDAGPPRGRVRGFFTGDEPNHRGRGAWLLVVFLAMGMALTVRLVDVQVRQGGVLRAKAAAQDTQTVTLQAQRGRIFDDAGRVLVSNVRVYDVFADPSLIPIDQRSAVATQLAAVLGMGPSKVLDLVSRDNTRYVLLARSVSDAAQQKLVALGLEGVGVIPKEQRSYTQSPVPGQSFASNLLGYVDANGTGQYGVEAHYDAALRGHDGTDSTLHDVQGNPIILSSEARVAPRDGSDLQLGIDSQVQYWAEQALAQGMQYAQASAGQIIIMDTRSGAIRAWADAPSYDANHYGASPLGNLRDANIADLYEPGSVMKAITFAGGLDHQAFTPDTMINEGPVSVDGYTIGDWDHHAHGNVSMRTVLEQSLNDGAIRAENLMGNDAYYTNLLAFDMGAPTGVDLAGEANQPLAAQRHWKQSQFDTAAFGQGVLVSPVEMVAGINAIANGGVWVQPHAVQAVTDPATGQSTQVAPTSRRIISEQTSAVMRKLMVDAVDAKGASGFLARIPGLKGQVAGKTGTASVAVAGHYQGDVIASFAGFAPADHPQFTMLVIYRYPQEHQIDREGAYLAAPTFRTLTTIIADLWRIKP